MELPEISLGEPEREYLETGPGPRSPEIPTEPKPEPDIQVTQEDMAERVGIQSEIQNENKETRARVEEMLEILLKWNEVQDLVMDD